MSPRVRQSRGIDADIVLSAALTLFSDRGYRATTMDDIGAELGIKGPSLYKHVRSKQDLLHEIMQSTMEVLIRNQSAAMSAGGNCETRLRRAVEAHVRYHAAHKMEAFVGNREVASLEQPYRDQVLNLRDEYEHRLRSLIEEGCVEGEFNIPSPKLVSYAILEMGIGVSVWFDPRGEYTVDEVVYMYSELAIRMVTDRVTSVAVEQLPLS
jgi:AcrR family transcriptional regulator